MSKKPKTVRGMNDILPDVAARWQHLESEVEDLIEAYGYRQVRLPLLAFGVRRGRAAGSGLTGNVTILAKV